MIPDDLVSPHIYQLYNSTLSSTSSKMASTTPIECEYNYYYQPDYYNPPGSCINEFKDLGDLIDYIDTQTEDCYAERNDFEESHTGTDGQVLDIVNMSARNVSRKKLTSKYTINT